MSEIPRVNWTDFIKIVKQGKLPELKSVEVFFNDDYFFTAIIGHGDMFSRTYARTQAEYLGVKANIVGGSNPEELLENKYESSVSV